MRIGQKIKDEKTGTLTHGGGIISLSPSTVNVGGVQVDTDALSRTISSDVTLVANTLYMIYVVLSGGAPVIRISTNVNSIGPSGFASWKLVGAFYSNGITTPAFGSFVNITGAPVTNWNLYTISAVVGVTGFGDEGCYWRQNGDSIELKGVLAGGTSNGSTFSMSIPTNRIIDTNKINTSAPDANSWGKQYNLQTNSIPAASGGPFTVFSDTAIANNLLYASVATAGARFAKAVGTSILTTGGRIRFEVKGLPISGFSNTQLKDL